MSASWRLFPAAPRFMPLLGVLAGVVGGAVYWLGSQLWPASVSVVLSMLATTAMSGGSRDTAGNGAVRAGMAGFVFALLLEYNALMALSAASLPFAVPAN